MTNRERALEVATKWLRANPLTDPHQIGEHHRACWEAIYEAGRADQRRLDVARLRDIAEQYDHGDMLPRDDYAADSYRDAARSIEKGEH